MKTTWHKLLEDKAEKLKLENQKLLEKTIALKNEKNQYRKELADFRKLISRIPGMVIMVQDGHLVFLNENAWSQLGYTEKEIAGCSILDIFKPRSAEIVASIVQNQASAKSVPERFEAHMRNKDGGALTCEVSWKKIRHQGSPAFLFNVMDLEIRKREEKRHRQSQKNGAVAMMVSGLRRDIKRALGIAAGTSFQIQNLPHPLGTDLIRMLRKFEAAFEVGNLLAQQLDCLTKLESQDSEMELFNPEDILQEAVIILEPYLNENRDVSRNIHTYVRKLSPILGSRKDLRDALVCLLLNAIESIAESGDIYVTAEENSGFDWIFIQDNGVGIPDDIIPKIFDPYFTTKTGNHSGLGLSLAYAIIHRHGGGIEVFSQDGEGAGFTVKLPICKQKETPACEVKRSANRIKDAHFLIISGADATSDLVTQLIIHKGGNVSVVYTCQDGLKLTKRKSIDFVFVDTDVDDFGRSDIVSKIRKIKKGLPIALIDAGINRKLLKTLKADLILQRPLILEQVSELVSGLLADTRQLE